MAASPAPPAVSVSGIDHVTFVVSSVAGARGFYGGLLGLAELAPPHAGQDGRARAAFAVGAQRIEIEEGEAGEDGRLGHLAFAAAAPARFVDPDGHALELVVATKRAPVTGAVFSGTIAHVGLLAGSLGASLRFYRDGLGFQEFWRGGGSPARLDWVNLRVPAGADYVELMLYDQLPAPGDRGGKNHVCIFVSDVVAAAARLEARPARKAYPRALEVKVGRNGKRQLNLFDPDGTRVELMEPVTTDGQPVPPSLAPPPRP
jgi:lactoylglutathione lyase